VECFVLKVVPIIATIKYKVCVVNVRETKIIIKCDNKIITNNNKIIILNEW